jgi:hypothetical protein
MGQTSIRFVVVRNYTCIMKIEELSLICNGKICICDEKTWDEALKGDGIMPSTVKSRKRQFCGWLKVM